LNRSQQWRKRALLAGAACLCLAAFLLCPDARHWNQRVRPEDTTGPLCQVYGSELRCYGKADGLSTSTGSMAVTEDALGNLWVGYDTGLARWKPGASAVYGPRGLKLNGGMVGVTGIAVKPDGSLWVGIAPSGPGLGLERLIDCQWKPFVTPELDGRTLEVATLFQDREDALWVGTLKQGIYRLYHDKVDSGFGRGRVVTCLSSYRLTPVLPVHVSEPIALGVDSIGTLTGDRPVAERNCAALESLQG
jgi:hypothetical protein